MRRREFTQPLPRATMPMLRRDGTLVPATWREAIAAAAEGLQATARRYGPDACCCFSCSKAGNELNFVAQKFMRSVVGTNNIDSCNRT